MFERWSNSLQEIPVTWGLVTLHFLLYLYVASVDPTFGTDTLQKLGGQHNPSVWDGEYYRLLVCAFLHGGWFHFLLNNLALISLGRLLERLLGSAGYGLLYLLSLFGGNIASLIWMPPSAVSVGASGAIMGLAGALVSLLLLDRQGRFLVARPSGRSLFFGLVLLQFLIGEVFSFINNAAHIGGFLVGVCFGVYFWSRIPGEGLPRRAGSAVMGACLVVMGVLLYIGLTPQERYVWHFHQGQVAFQSKKPKKAKEAAAKAERELLAALKKQEAPAALTLLGELYLQRQQFKKAVPIFQKLAKKAPDDIGSWYGLLRALAKSGQTKQANAAYKKARAQFVAKEPGWSLRSFFMPQHPYQRTLLHARLLTAALKDREAILLYQQLMKENPDSPLLHNDYAWLLVTAHDPKYRNATIALDYAKSAVKHSANAAFLDTLAMAYYRNKQFKQAVETEKKALTSPGAAQTMPHLMFQLQRFQKALDAITPKKKTKKQGKNTKNQDKGAKKQDKGLKKQNKDATPKTRKPLSTKQKDAAKKPAPSSRPTQPTQ